MSAGKMTLEALSVEKMLHGHLSMDLCDRVTWDSFPEFAQAFVQMVDGEVLERINTVMDHLWKVRVRGVELRLFFEDFPVMATLESDTDAGDAVITDLFAEWQVERDTLPGLFPLELTGWKVGMQTIKLIQAVQKYSTTMSLWKAKHDVEALLDGRPMNLRFASEEIRDEFRKVAEELGAVCGPL